MIIKVLNLLTGRIQYSFVVLEGGIALWFFPDGQKKKKKKCKAHWVFSLRLTWAQRV